MNGGMTAEGLFGCAPMTATLGTAAPTQHMASASDGLSGWTALVHPDNPLVWLGGIILVTVGLAGVAGRVKLGPASAAVQVGKS